MAGNYAAQLSPYTLAFLRQWEDLYTLSKKAILSNFDNGALHVALLQDLQGELNNSFGRSPQQALEFVKQRWSESADIPTYDRFVAAAKLSLGPRRVFKNVLIQRRGHGFCEDNDMMDGI